MLNIFIIVSIGTALGVSIWHNFFRKGMVTNPIKDMSDDKMPDFHDDPEDTKGVED